MFFSYKPPGGLLYKGWYKYSKFAKKSITNLSRFAKFFKV